MKYKFELCLVALLPVSMLIGYLLGGALVWLVSVNNVQVMSDTTQGFKTQHRASVKLKAGYDVRLQPTIPAYSLNMAHFENNTLVVK